MRKGNLRKFLICAVAVLFSVAMSFSALAAENAGDAVGPAYQTYFDGEELAMLANQSQSQMMSFVLTTKNGNVIVIDGGTPEDAAHLRQAIAAKGGHVTAWFITHPHSDHGGAFAQIVEEGLNGMVIDNVIFNFTDPVWYQTYEGYRADTVERIRNAVNTVGALGTKLTVMHRNDIFTFDGVNITCMNDPYLVDHNSINNSSCVLRVDMGGKRIMFLGDMGEDVGEAFLADHAGEDLKCDIVQMAHHGQAGVGQHFYQVLSPTTCLWCAPEWLYEDYNNQYATKTTRQWMKDLGVRDHKVIKDGDRVLW